MRGFYFMSRALCAFLFAIFSRIAYCGATESGTGIIRFRTRNVFVIGRGLIRTTHVTKFYRRNRAFFMLNQKESLCLFQ